MNNVLDYETAVIGSLLIEPGALGVIRGALAPGDFVGALAREAYSAALALSDSGEGPDVMLIASRMERAYSRETVSRYLAGCMELTPTAANVAEYCRLVKNESMRRALSAIADSLADTSRSWDENARRGLDALGALLRDGLQNELLSGSDMARNFRDYRERLETDRDRLICSTRFPALDRVLGGGLYAGGMYIIGARPGMGKTTLALNIAGRLAARGKRVLFISLEMSDRQITAKRVSHSSGVSYTKLMSGALDVNEKLRVDEALSKLESGVMYLNAKYGLTVSEIASLARRVEGLDLLVVDYFGLIRTEGRSLGRYEDTTVISQRLKQLALALDIPLVVLAQLNRLNESRQDKRPQLSDLRDTGALEQDADGVLLLHREDYYARNIAEKNDADGKMELILAKNRHGYTGAVEMLWDGERGTVEMLWSGEEPPF